MRYLDEVISCVEEKATRVVLAIPAGRWIEPILVGLPSAILQTVIAGCAPGVCHPVNLDPDGLTWEESALLREIDSQWNCLLCKMEEFSEVWDTDSPQSLLSRWKLMQSVWVDISNKVVRLNATREVIKNWAEADSFWRNFNQKWEDRVRGLETRSGLRPMLSNR